MAYQGGSSGGNMARRPSNPWGHFTPSPPTPATIVGAQASQALFQFQENHQFDASIGARAPQLSHPTADDTLVLPPAMAPQTFHFQPHNAINTLPYQPNNYNYNYAHGWSQSQAQPVVMDGYGATSWAPRPMLPSSGGPGSWAPAPPVPVQQPGAGAGAGGQASSWASWTPPAQQRPGNGMPAAPPTNGYGSVQAPQPQVTGNKTLEEFLMEAGVVGQGTLDKIILDELAEAMLGDDDGQAERDDRFLSLGDLLLALGLDAGSSSGSGSGPRTHQLRMPAPADQAAAGSSSAGPSSSRHRARIRGQAAAAAEARERRSRRTAMRRAKGGRN